MPSNLHIWECIKSKDSDFLITYLCEHMIWLVYLDYINYIFQNNLKITLKPNLSYYSLNEYPLIY